LSSVRLQDAYAVGGAEPRGISTSYSVPLDGKTFPIGPFPFTPRGISIVNQTAGVITVNDDRGASYVANPLTATTFGLGPTLYLSASISPAQTSGKATVIVYDSPQAIASAQLAALAPAGSNIQRVSALPASPFDGQVISLVVDAATYPGVEWLLIYNVATGYWDVIGGEPLTIPATAVGSVMNTLTQVGATGWFYSLAAMSLLLPFAGDYEIAGGLNLGLNGSGTTQGSLTIFNGVTLANSGNSRVDFNLGPGTFAGSWTEDFITGLAGGTRVGICASSGAAGTNTVSSARFRVMPRRIH
jgi:hypothetical protein